MVRYHSRFGGMWLDRVDAPAEIERRLDEGRIDEEAAKLASSWIENGFLILPGAISTDLVDRLNKASTAAIAEEDPRFLATALGENGGEPMRLERRLLDMATVKLLDAYYYLPEAREILLNEAIAKVLMLIFEHPPLLFQSLSFVKSSEQWLHQDAVYVKVDPPLDLAAAWIALEDVQEGSGELRYVPGSHRLSDFLFSGKFKHWYPARDGTDAHETWLGLLNEEIAARGLKVEEFRPRKGDVFIWHAQLVHGGKPIEDQSLTRRSIVGHYCPESATPEILWSSPSDPHGVVPRWPRKVPRARGGRNPSIAVSRCGSATYVSSYYRA